MVSHCPNCGAEMEEGYKFCLNCGAEIQSNSGSFEEQAAQTPAVNTPVPVQQPVYSQTQDYVPIHPRKSNKKLIVAIVAIIAVVIVLVLILVLFVFNNNSSDFVGTWTLDSMAVNGTSMPVPGGVTIKFNSDGTYEATSGGSTQTGKWEVKDGKFYDASSNTTNSPFSSYGWSYQFSGGGNTLTMSCFAQTEDYTVEYVFKKSSSSSNSDGGNLHELDNGLIGNWNATSAIYNGSSIPGVDIAIDFNSDGTYNLVYYSYANENGTWYVSGGKLYLRVSSGYSVLSYNMGMDYQLSNGGNTLTFGYSMSLGSETITISYVFERL